MCCLSASKQRASKSRNSLGECKHEAHRVGCLKASRRKASKWLTLWAPRRQRNKEQTKKASSRWAHFVGYFSTDNQRASERLTLVQASQDKEARTVRAVSCFTLERRLIVLRSWEKTVSTLGKTKNPIKTKGKPKTNRKQRNPLTKTKKRKPILSNRAGVKRRK